MEGDDDLVTEEQWEQIVEAYGIGLYSVWDLIELYERTSAGRLLIYPIYELDYRIYRILQGYFNGR